MKWALARVDEPTVLCTNTSIYRISLLRVDSVLNLSNKPELSTTNVDSLLSHKVDIIGWLCTSVGSNIIFQLSVSTVPYCVVITGNRVAREV